jgi:hypothetical protein
VSGQDLFFTSNIKDFAQSDALELKDNISERSMDSAYHSQTSRPRATNTFQMLPPQDSQGQLADPYFGNELASPSLHTDNLTPFSEPQSMSQMETAASQQWYTDAFSGQMISPFSTTPTNPTHTSPYNTEYPWATADSSSLDFSMQFDPFPQDFAAEPMFGPHFPPQQQQRRSVPTPAAPATKAPTAIMHGARRSSMQSTSLGAYLSSPSTMHAQSFASIDFEQPLLQTR